MAIKRAQTALEYLMIIAGAIALVIIVIVIIRGVFNSGGAKTEIDTTTLDENYLRPYIFFDDFESKDATDSKWGEHLFINSKTMVSDGTLMLGLYDFLTTRSVFDNFTASFKVTNVPKNPRWGGANYAEFSFVFRFNGTKSYNLSFNSYSGDLILSSSGSGVIKSVNSQAVKDMYTGTVTFIIKVYGNRVWVYPYNTKNTPLIGFENNNRGELLPDPVIPSGAIGIYRRITSIVYPDPTIQPVDTEVFIDDFKVWDETPRS
ncbi:hypothetical protein HY989_03270 [Candidatus Micrarchaeota archaeon]|nr:hypothetical protein [Candidatus Micrarchaeota archaeon]